MRSIPTKLSTAALTTLILATAACGPTVTTRPEVVTGRTTQRNVLAGDSLVPVTSKWNVTQQGFAGELEWKDACVVESKQVVTENTVTETKPNKGGNIAWIVVGSALVLGGMYALSATKDANEDVYCSDENDPDSCNSEESALTELGIGLLTMGASAGGWAIVRMSQKPTAERAAGKSRTVTRRGNEKTACASREAFDGLKVSVQIPDGGRWDGTATSDGKVEIQIGSGVRAPVGVPMTISVDEVPPALASFLRHGQVIGEVTVPETVAEVTPQPKKKRAR